MSKLIRGSVLLEGQGRIMEDVGGGGHMWFAAPAPSSSSSPPSRVDIPGQVGPKSVTGILRTYGSYRKGAQPFLTELEPERV